MSPNSLFCQRITLYGYCGRLWSRLNVRRARHNNHIVTKDKLRRFSCPSCSVGGLARNAISALVLILLSKSTVRHFSDGMRIYKEGEGITYTAWFYGPSSVCSKVSVSLYSVQTMIVLTTFVILPRLVEGLELERCCQEALFRRCGWDNPRSRKSTFGIA